MREYYAKLDGHKVVPIDDVMEWVKQFEIRHRRVAEEYVGDARISTVFLAINYASLPSDPPLWFETMIFGGNHNGYQERYTSWDEAVLGHAMALALAKADT